VSVASTTNIFQWRPSNSTRPQKTLTGIGNRSSVDNFDDTIFSFNIMLCTFDWHRGFGLRRFQLRFVYRNEMLNIPCTVTMKSLFIKTYTSPYGTHSRINSANTMKTIFMS